MPNPETNLWNSFRQKLKDKDYFFTRIENRGGGGLPDTYIVGDRSCFWVELKVAKGNKVNVSPHQIAWNIKHYTKGCISFFLVRAPLHSNLFLFEGSKALHLARNGLKTGSLVHGSWSEILDHMTSYKI